MQEWALLYLKTKENNGEVATGKALMSASDNFAEDDLGELVRLGFITLEQTNVIPSLQSEIMMSTKVKLTEKGRRHGQIR